MPVEKCILKNLRKGEAANLPDIIVEGTSKKVIGRNTETLIESPAVSREHRKFYLLMLLLMSRNLFSYHYLAVIIKPKLEDSVVLVRFVGKSPACEY